MEKRKESEEGAKQRDGTKRKEDFDATNGRAPQISLQLPPLSLPVARMTLSRARTAELARKLSPNLKRREGKKTEKSQHASFGSSFDEIAKRRRAEKRKKKKLTLCKAA